VVGLVKTKTNLSPARASLLGLSVAIRERETQAGKEYQLIVKKTQNNKKQGLNFQVKTTWIKKFNGWPKTI
jgi:hypothetical protein